MAGSEGKGAGPETQASVIKPGDLPVSVVGRSIPEINARLWYHTVVETAKKSSGELALVLIGGLVLLSLLYALSLGPALWLLTRGYMSDACVSAMNLV